MAVREFTDKRMLYNLDNEIDRIEDFKIIDENNMLLVERIQDTSKYVNTDLLVVKDWSKATHAERFFKVIKAPKKLCFSPHQKHSVLYDTDVEVFEGDIIYVNHLESLNSWVYTFKDKVYHTIKYDSIYCVLRGEEVVPVNGYVLLLPIKEKGGWGDHEFEYLHPNEATVAKLSVPNNDYKRNYHPDSGKRKSRTEGVVWSDYGYEEMEIGDRVRVWGNIGFNGTEKDAYVVPLEMPEHRALKEPYLITQRPRIQYIIKNV